MTTTQSGRTKPGRKRRKSTRIMLRAAAFVTTLAPVFWVFLFVRFHRGEVVIRYDYIAMLNETAAQSPPEQRAWPLLRAAILELEERLPDDVNINLCCADDPANAEWQEITRRLNESSGALEKIRIAALMPYLGFQVTHTISEEDRALWPDLYEEALLNDAETLAISPFVSLQNPHTNKLRRLGRALAADGRRASMDGDGATVIRDFNAIIGLAEMIREAPSLFSELTGVSMYSMGFGLFMEQIHKHPESFSDAQLEVMQDSLRSIDDATLRVSFDADRWAMLDVFQRCYTDDGAGGGHFVASQFEYLPGAGHRYTKWAGTTQAYVWSFISPGRREIERFINKMFDDPQRLMLVPLWERRDEKVDSDFDSLSRNWRWKFSYARLMIEILAPAFSRATISSERLIQERDAAQTVIALERYRRAHGSWPTSLEALVPEYIPGLPIDRFIGEPLGYRLDEGGEPILYSVGVNLEDDGGVVDLDREGWPTNHRARRWHPRSKVEAMKASPGRRALIPDADYILWPPLPDKPIEPDEELDPQP